MTFDEFTAAFRHVLLGTSDTERTNRYEAHEPVSEILLSEIIVKYYRDKFSVANFALTKVRRIFAEPGQTPNTNNGTERGETLFTTAQVTEIINDLVRQTYLIKVPMDKTDSKLTPSQRSDGEEYFRWKFANVTEGDVIGIPVQYKDTQYDGVLALTNPPMGLFTLCIEHKIQTGNTIYECEFEERLGHANLTQAEVTFKELADLKEEFDAEKAVFSGTVASMIGDVYSHTANTFAYFDSDTTKIDALIVELQGGVYGIMSAGYMSVNDYEWLSVLNTHYGGLDTAGQENVRKTGYEGIRNIINEVRDFCTRYVLKYWETVAEVRTLVRAEAGARLNFGHPRYNPGAVEFLDADRAKMLMESRDVELNDVTLASVRNTLQPLAVYKFEYVNGTILQSDLAPTKTAADLSELLPVGEYFCHRHTNGVVVGLKSYRSGTESAYNDANTYIVAEVDWNDTAKFPVTRFEMTASNASDLVGTTIPARNVTDWLELPVGVYSYQTMVGGGAVVFLKSVTAPTDDDMYGVVKTDWENFPNVQTVATTE